MLRLLSNPTNRHFLDGNYWYYYRELDEESGFRLRVSRRFLYRSGVITRAWCHLPFQHQIICRRHLASLEGVLHDLESLDRIMRIADYPMRFFSDTGFDVPFSNLTQYYPIAEDGDLPDCLTEAGQLFYNMMLESHFHRAKDEEETENIVKQEYSLTYRDYVGGDEFVSLHTYTKARESLEAEWLSL